MKTAVRTIEFQIDICLTAEYYRATETIKSPSPADESRLSMQKCNDTSRGQMWAVRGMHICHSNEDKCLAISFNNENTDRGVLMVDLVPYNEASKFQQWKINAGVSGRAADQVVNIETDLVLGIKGSNVEGSYFPNVMPSRNNGNKISGRQWSFVPVSAPNGGMACAIISLSN